MERTDMIKRVAVALVMVSLLGGCSTMKSWFGGKNAAAKKAAEPAELVKFDATIKPRKAWSVDLGDGERRIGARQGPAVADGRVFAAAGEGRVLALDLQTGKRVWEFKADKKEGLRLTGGPGVGGGLVAVGGLDGTVLVLDAQDGSERWRAKVRSEIIAAPTVTQGVVVVRGNDGRITAFDAANGEERWSVTRELPNLTVRGNAKVTAAPGLLFVGHDDGALVALALQDGRVLWEQAVGLPEGRTELERMADVDSPVVIDGTMLYSNSYRSRTLAIDGPSGRPMWQSDHGGAGAIGVAPSAVLVSTAAGSVYALDKSNGVALWSQPALARRSLTGPAVQGDYAVVGDYAGYLHWLRLDNGEMAGRAKVGRKRAIRGALVEADGLLLVQDVKGGLTAFRLD
ncbi:outer membrane assembly lipoprotein YfgL [Pseudoxanthomonas suwonensis 11-1]|uniref:Outer membrane protein assembly factor BamB n=1 Tax=Pseudoxanthomonas suwonensis (strain 11-1) TaxID=743721 RepID=E6WSN2_PSEUU|nr:outer membrane protein assembly factor BamB [Pseudoxanthomonas suwonensis]ADV27246.1 outer membrane assembly lipoprotein YfgL [Pseudoxanthomonas suwonensis 11-1]